MSNEKSAKQSLAIKILAVDDEKAITDMLVRYFTYEGYEITGINDPNEALELVRKSNFLVCLLDIQMPGMSGLDLLKAIKQENGMTAVFMMTAFATTENVLTALRRGAETCYLKPLNNLEMMRADVDRAIERFKGWQELIQRLKSMEASR